VKSIEEVSHQIEDDLRRYIESTYHLRDPGLVAQRRALIRDQGIATEPWVEATPRYQSGDHFRNLALPEPVVSVLEDLAADGLDIFDPPYKHQADALEAFFDGQDLVVSTGTGSGKTEIFLYSILGQLALEASRDVSTTVRGVRTLVLYPMNALVADQMSRMRLMFGDDDGADTLEGYMGRRVQFGMYTSRTPYHGKYDTDKNDYLIKPVIDRYLELAKSRPDLFDELKESGRIPAKDLEGFRAKNKKKETHFRTQPGDTELFTRHEMHSGNDHGGTPDILITNYSMLEYMLLRPIEQSLFEDTREWLAADSENELNIVLDEAHLYRGAQGAEISLLLNRLLQKLDIPRERVRFILTSATLGADTERNGPEFAARLTSADPATFSVVTGARVGYGQGQPGDQRVAELLETVRYDITEPKVRNLASQLGWRDFESGDAGDHHRFLAENLEADPLFHKLHEELKEAPCELDDLANKLFPDVETTLAREATGNLLYLGTEAAIEGKGALLPTRLHMLVKGLPSLYACVNPACPDRREATEESGLLGRIYTNPRTTCDACDSRVFELLSHRTCGAAYLRAFREHDAAGDQVFLWSERGNSPMMDELHILVESPRDDPDPLHEQRRSLREQTTQRWLDIKTGHLHVERGEHTSGQSYIEVWIPSDEPNDKSHPWSFTRCPACGIEERRRPSGDTKISDLASKGEEPFATAVRSMFRMQPPDPDAEDYPNEGKKILCFSDGRQKAARLARDLQERLELDSFREVIADITSNSDVQALPLAQIYPEFVLYCKRNNLSFFNNKDKRSDYDGSRSLLQTSIEDRIPKLMDAFDLEDEQELLTYEPARDALANERPRQFDQLLLRSLGDSNFSFMRTVVGYLRPLPSIFQKIESEFAHADSDLIEAIIIQVLWLASNEYAFDKQIRKWDRSEAKPYGYVDEAGVAVTDILPTHLERIVEGKLDVGRFRKLLLSELFDVEGVRAFIKPEAVTLDLQLEGGWYRCEGCGQFSAVSIDGQCPQEDCGAKVHSVDDDIAKDAKTSYAMQPVREVVKGERDPFTLRSEEHSAQLGGKDASQTFTRSEVYELLFQDILVGDDEHEQPIDVLSCTTTMEVGIDIGSLTGVAMRNIPPGAENYEQRAGRAGRTGAGLSTILTFADNSPHESHYFDHAEELIGAEGTPPIIYSGNEKIVRRHINASLLARFFDPSDMEASADVFESLGSCAEFFDGGGSYSLERFDEWMSTHVLDSDSSVVDALAALLPDEVGDGQDDQWRVPLIRDTAEQFLTDLHELDEETSWEDTQAEEQRLLDLLLKEALIPNFSFPTDVCDFVVQTGSSQGIETEYDMSRNMTQALSTYIPGREIVVDKKTFTSYGVFDRFAPDPVNRAANLGWDDPSWFNYCPRCETVYGEGSRSLADDECEVCTKERLISIPRITPDTFAPKVDTKGEPQQEDIYEEERLYATSPKYPLTPYDEGDGAGGEPAPEKEFGNAVVTQMGNQPLVVANLGLDEEGFSMCRKCGAVARDGELDATHERPYPVVRRGENDVSSTCDGRTENVVFYHEFQSDIVLMQIPLHNPLRYRPHAEWFKTAAQTVSEALVLGAARVLDLEHGELEGGFRTRSASGADESGILGYVEIFLFDTTPGGAGFATRVWEEFEAVVEVTRSILADCECESACHDCLRSYTNRHIHDKLDRFTASALMEYAIDGVSPSVPEERAIQLMKRLERTMQFQHPDLRINQSTTTGEWQVRTDEQEVAVGLRSCLREDRSSSEPLDVDLPDDGIRQDLPRVSRRLNQRLSTVDAG
jgi:ATP-dependent helicase YprA (DUF1998 family)